MEFIKFAKEYNRMCDSYENCVYCGLSRYVGNPLVSSNCRLYCFSNPEIAQEIVQEWAWKNPVKTRKMDFLERCPNAKIDNLGAPHACVEEIYGIDIDCQNINCVKCWNMPIEE